MLLSSPPAMWMMMIKKVVHEKHYKHQRENFVSTTLCVQLYTQTHFLRVCVCLYEQSNTILWPSSFLFTKCLHLYHIGVRRRIYTFYKYTKMCVMITIYLVNHGKWFSFLCYVHRLENYRVTHTQTHTKKRQENPKCVQTNSDFIVLVCGNLNDSWVRTKQLYNSEKGKAWCCHITTTQNFHPNIISWDTFVVSCGSNVSGSWRVTKILSSLL